MPINLRPGSGYDIAGTSGGGGNPVTVAVTPATVRQSSPGAQVYMATPSGGTAPYTFVWAALYSDGTSANALLST